MEFFFTIRTIMTTLNDAMTAFEVAVKNRILKQNPNLLFNGSGEFGAKNWTLGANGMFGSVNDTVNGQGYYFTNQSAISSVSESEKSPTISVGANQSLMMAIDVANAATAGTLQIALNAYNASNTLLGAVGSITVPNGQALSRNSVSGTTPAGTTYVQVEVVLTGLSAPANGVVFRRCKVEAGTVQTPYSEDASVAQMSLTPGPATYDLHNFINGKPVGSEVLMRAVAVRGFTIAQNFPSSFAYCSVASSATFVISVLKNGAQVGTITFAANALSGVFASGSNITFNPGDTVALQCQASADSTLSDLTIGILGTST
jgi:hypothetical protein